MKNLLNSVAAITGAGIGRALAVELASQGCHVALADINLLGLEQSRELLKAYDVAVSIHRVDVSQQLELERFASEVVEQHGCVNILINNAGITLQKNFESHSSDDWQRVIGINLFGVIYGCQAFLPYLRAADTGHIVNLSSMAGFAGLPTQSSYSASKAAVKALSESLWSELKQDNIGVTCVHPGAIKTNMIQATLSESDDMALAQKNLVLVQRFALPVEQAAKIIVTAIKKNKQRVLVGKDSVLLEIIKRLFPVSIHRLMAFAFKKLKAG
ncbi:MAG: SDR family NAD(P)-dependent oxidoreductase [Pseudomonadales bacterium]|nr:SDR family NAD(P)-dependent oxidoreductase [Pseudomonadales bacterium]